MVGAFNLIWPVVPDVCNVKSPVVEPIVIFPDVEEIFTAFAPDVTWTPPLTVKALFKVVVASTVKKLAIWIPLMAPAPLLEIVRGPVPVCLIRASSLLKLIPRGDEISRFASLISLTISEILFLRLKVFLFII